MSNRFKLKPLALATLLVSQGAVNGAFAQSDEIEEDEVSSEAEVVEVTGFRGSLLKSQALKRNSEQLTDAIFAEDIGKSTDQNIADALSRVTGVSVQSKDGEGTKITVRGANPDQNLITLNGSLLTSGDFNQSVDLSTFSSDVLSKIEVVKSSSADQDEGSLGASINLYTAKPLELKENLRSVTLQGRYSDFTEKTNSKISGSFSQKFLDDKLGFLVTGFDEDFDVRNDKIEFGQYKVIDVVGATDQRGNVVSGFKALGAESLKYGLNRNNRQRAGATAAVQFTPTSTTDISADYSYTKQIVQNADDFARVELLAAEENYSQGVPHSKRKVPNPANPSNEIPLVPDFSDDHAAWTTVDTDSRTISKLYRRFGRGSLGRVNGGEVTENGVFNFKVTQFIGDAIQVDLGVNSSKTELTFLPNSTASSASWNVVNEKTLQFLGPESDEVGIQPVGYDCSAGGGCAFEFGDGVTTLNTPNTVNDNRSRTGFNPFDANSQHVGNISFTERTVNDDNESAFVDVDWDVDFFGINQIEFGVKLSKRNKSVDDQSYGFRNTVAPITISTIDPITQKETGAEIVGGSAISSIPLSEVVTDEPFPVDNFLDSLGVPRSRLTEEGWTLFSADKIFDKVFGNGDFGLVADNTQTRAAELKSRAAYLKFNFAAVDDRLTGNIGVRYVNTKLLNEGFAGASYQQTDGKNVIFDPFEINKLRDQELKPCPKFNEIRDANGNAIPGAGNGDQRKWSRFDGTGWNLNGTVDDFSDDIHIPDVGDCNNLDDFDKVGTGWWGVWNYADISTERLVRPNPDDPEFEEDRDKNSFKQFGENSYSLLLPSLTVNFALTDDIVLRFASSETMSRPNIDDLKPGFRISENVWNETASKITLGSPDLLPQRSRNLDIAFEWYFSDKNAVSATFFSKNLTDFLETENQITYAEDLRKFDFENEIYDQADLILSEQEVKDRLANSADKYGRGECHPFRVAQNNLQDDRLFTDRLREPEKEFNKCREFRVSRQRNGARGKIKGIELGYTQSFDFLPGFWGGFGTQLNYTLQDSSNSREPSSIVKGTLLPEFPRAFTPERSYNATIFWEQNGHQVRLAWRGKSDELVQRSTEDGALWQEGSVGLDMSATYKINEDIAINFDAVNLTDTLNRRYWTSRFALLGETGVDEEGKKIDIPFDEGSVFEGGANRSRTKLLSKTGTQYRISLNVKF